MNVRVMVGSQPVNGLPVIGWYVYRGTGEDTLTGHLSDAALGVGTGNPVGRPPQGGRCADCGYSLRGRRHRRACGPRSRPPGREAGEDGRCLACGYRAGSRNCKTVH